MEPSFKRLQKNKVTGNFEDIYIPFSSSAVNDSSLLIKGNYWCRRNFPFVIYIECEALPVKSK